MNCVKSETFLGLQSNLPTLNDLDIDYSADQKIDLWLSRNNLLDFTERTYKEYQSKWYHKVLCEKLDNLVNGKIKKLMVFMPPQHGKSELVSLRLPAFALGKNPNLKIALCSYAADLSEKFNRQVQRIIDTKEYNEIFPNVKLSQSVIVTKSMVHGRKAYLRNSTIFEVVDHEGYFRSVGVGGPLTGNKIDLGIIDDPIKDRLEAQSETYRARIWEWYLDVFCTRLHNNSKILLTMTRWHEDDLAGRILAKESDWEILSFPAIKENDENPSDIRKIGEALWPERHSKEKIENLRVMSERTFVSMYQQRPAPSEGDMFKSHWPRWFTKDQMPIFEKIILSVDASFTDNIDSCPASIQAWGKKGTNYYMLYDLTRRMGAIETATFIERVAKNYPGCIVVVEKAANGYFIIEKIKDRLPVFEFDPKRYGGKEVRAEMVAPLWETGNVFIYDNFYNRSYYLPEILSFPNAKMKDRVDAMSQALLYYTRSTPVFAVMTAGNGF